MPHLKKAKIHSFNFTADLICTLLIVYDRWHSSQLNNLQRQVELAPNRACNNDLVPTKHENCL